MKLLIIQQIQPPKNACHFPPRSDISLSKVKEVKKKEKKKNKLENFNLFIYLFIRLFIYLLIYLISVTTVYINDLRYTRGYGEIRQYNDISHSAYYITKIKLHSKNGLSLREAGYIATNQDMLIEQAKKTC